MAKKSSRKKKSKLQVVLHSLFYRIYFAVVLVVVIGIAVGTNYLNKLLADYESAQPAHVAEQAAQLFEDADYATIYSYDTTASDIADGDRNFYIDSMREIANGQTVTWTPAYSPSEDERHYNVMLSNEKFAEITLVPSGRVTDHGYRLWQLGSVTTYVAMGEQEVPEEPVEEEVVEEEPVEQVTRTVFHVTAPSESTVTVDGKRLSADDAVNTNIPTASAGLLPSNVKSPTLTEYAFYADSESPVITVTDKYGNPQTPASQEENSWTYSLPETPGLKDSFEGAVVKVAEDLARLSARTIKREKMLGYCASDSPARERVRQFDTSAGYSSKAGAFQNVVTSEYYQYSDNCFSCRVSFDYLSKYSSTVTKSYSTTYPLYFVNQNGKGKLYNFTFY